MHQRDGRTDGQTDRHATTAKPAKTALTHSVARVKKVTGTLTGHGSTLVVGSGKAWGFSVAKQ